MNCRPFTEGQGSHWYGELLHALCRVINQKRTQGKTILPEDSSGGCVWQMSPPDANSLVLLLLALHDLFLDDVWTSVAEVVSLLTGEGQ